MRPFAFVCGWTLCRNDATWNLHVTAGTCFNEQRFIWELSKMRGPLSPTICLPIRVGLSENFLYDSKTALFRTFVFSMATQGHINGLRACVTTCCHLHARVAWCAKTVKIQTLKNALKFATFALCEESRPWLSRKLGAPTHLPRSAEVEEAHFAISGYKWGA